MATARPPARLAAPPLRIIGVLVVLAAAVVYFVQHNVLRYVHYDAQTYGGFWPRRDGLVAHVAGRVIAVSVGLGQLWLGLTGRTGRLHRRLGQVYGAAVRVGSAGGFDLALTIDPKLAPYAAGLFMLCVAWLVTTSAAIVAIRHRAIEQHASGCCAATRSRSRS
jgi:hypothetical protein